MLMTCNYGLLNMASKSEIDKNKLITVISVLSGSTLETRVVKM